MKIVFTEKRKNETPVIVRIDSSSGTCHVMLRFLCDEAIAKESNFTAMVKDE